MTLKTETLRGGLPKEGWPRSKRDKGYVLTIEVIAYDNGTVAVNGGPPGEGEQGWIDAVGQACSLISIFHHDVRTGK